MSMVHPFAGVANETRVVGNDRVNTGAISTSLHHSQRNRRHHLLVASIGSLALLLAMLAAPVVSTQFAASAAPASSGYSAPDPGEYPVAQESATSGDAIANFAMQYLGYPYVWAGNTSAGFDCSGFTQFVLINTLGIDIGHGVAEQTCHGAWVDWGEWQPGDLVYFAGTYRAGVSHTGVYIGDGQFIHAENEGTGVVISSLYTDYYGGHYYGAFRHG